MRISRILLMTALLYHFASAQQDSLVFTRPVSLRDCIDYTLKRQPLIKQTELDQEIAERNINIRLADWFPQLSLDANLIHNTQLSTVPLLVPGGHLAPVNTSAINLTLTQTIFDRDVLLAGVTKSAVRQQARERGELTTIDVVVNVSKAYYAVLMTSTQLSVLADDIVRLKKNLEDTKSQYESGVVDKTDYERATISLNNAQAEEYQGQQLLGSRLAMLKDQMGYPARSTLELKADSTAWEQEMRLDTTLAVQYDNRVEYMELQTEKQLQQASVNYAWWSFLPSLSAFGSYTLSYAANEIPPLYNTSYPNSLIGLRLSLPLFEGGKRYQEISLAKLQLERTEYDIERSKQSIDDEFAQASANYKSSLRTYYALKENAELAKEVYTTLQLQYKSGIKTYLDVLTAENDLRSAEANRTNALFQVISGKLDVEKALGLIRTGLP